MDFDLYLDDGNEKTLPAPEVLLETLMVGVFVMGGSERVRLIQEGFKEEFGVLSANWVLLNEKLERDIYTIREVDSTLLTEDSLGKELAPHTGQIDIVSHSDDSTLVNYREIKSSLKKQNNDHNNKKKELGVHSNGVSPVVRKDGFWHHSGTFDFGKKGFWNEGWTCCGRAWDFDGCKKSKTDPYAAIRLLICFNHGQINPLTKKPDSICGCVFPREEDQDCRFHSGY
mmetsp:Transcript_110532/g.237889  ORF Transcript_110532/g.237889 Transcript_110532/m.237889 type:complete len:228 (+) Transcript_110532:1123-1806(+)